MIDCVHELPGSNQCAARGSAGAGLLRALRSLSKRSCAHATAGRAAPGASPRRFAHAAGPVGCRGEQDRPSACEDNNAADGDRGGLSQAENIGSCAGLQDFSDLLRGVTIDRGPGYHLHPDGVRLSLSGRGHVLVRAAFWPDVCCRARDLCRFAAASGSRDTYNIARETRTPEPRSCNLPLSEVCLAP
jgi:hypothetical protein